MAPAGDSLYGIKKAKAGPSKKDATSSTNLAFTSHLSSLISRELSTVPSSSQSSRGRPRPSRGAKDDIFAVHNRNTARRAAADLAVDDNDGRAVAQHHKTAAELGHVDEALLSRSRARMQEKARLYEELKKGEHLADSSSDDEEGVGAGSKTDASRHAARNAHYKKLDSHSLVDFDRKWAEEERKKHRGQAKGEKDGSAEEEAEEDGDDEDEPLIEYTDEFGRTRMGTRAEAAAAQHAAATGQPAGAPRIQTPTVARPAMPAKIIHGPTIQAHAFNPDDNVARQMAALAAKRDRAPTPPPETHYDAEHEIRTRGTGFYAFSHDEETRRREMEELKQARSETLEERQHGQQKKRKRDEAKEERKRRIEELRSKRRAEEFLKGLGSQMPDLAADTDT